MSLCSILGRLKLISDQKNVGIKFLSLYHQQRLLSSKQPKQHIIKDIDPSTGEEKKRKTRIIPKITLLSGDDMNIVTLEEAQSISKRRDLKLVKITDLDTKTQRPVYKLMTGVEYHTEELKNREQRKKDKEGNFIKGEKVLLLNATISEHDLQTQIKKVLKWISKFFEVRVVINGAHDQGEKVYSILENSLKTEARILQKRAKGTDIKFQVVPPKKESGGNNDKKTL